MARDHYDIVTVGGGIGGAALGKAMAEHGARVLILERERRFRDRVRGEFITPWGVAEAQALGICGLVRNRCGLDVRWTDLGFGPRDMVATTPQRLPCLSFYHPEMQEAVLEAAAKAGAEVRREACVKRVEPGSIPSVVVEWAGRIWELEARLIVGADGRNSLARRYAGFKVHQQRKPFLFAGVLLENVSAPAATAFVFFNPDLGLVSIATGQGRGRFRAYLGYREDAEYKLHGPASLPRFLQESIRTGPLGRFYAEARAVGPLASFQCGDFWVEHPFRDGVALVGDAAATSDPAFGQGLSLTLRDVRVLRDLLLMNGDWDAAGRIYAREHDSYFAVIHKVIDWFRQIFIERGPEASALRARALPLIAKDSTRLPDHFFSGPELAADEAARRRFFGDD
jgi:2-polyprenyl-6-methoxyphenol hydroxylase-like FAD-dependent oxidoreductase